MRFEYDTLVLERTPGTADHIYHWRCCRRRSCHKYDDLESFLNEMGQDGWHVAAYANGERFNCTVILQRRLDDDGNPGDQAPLVPGASPPAPSVSMTGLRAEVRALAQESVAVQTATSEALLSEVQALRRDMTNVPAAPSLTAESLTEAVAAAVTACAPAPSLTREDLREALAQPKGPTGPSQADILAGLDELLQRIAARPDSATLSPEAFAALEQTLTAAVQKATIAPAMVKLDPEAMQMLERAVEDRNRDDDPPGGPPIVILDPATLQSLQETYQSAADQIQAALAREVVVQPEIHVDARAELTEKAADQIQAAVAAGLQAMPAPTAEITEASLERLQSILQAASQQPSRISAVLGADVVPALQSALAGMPQPVVQAQATLASESVEALRSALAEAIEALLTRTPAPVVEVTPAVTVILDEAALKRLSAQSVMLDPSSVVGLQAAVADAVGAALERHARQQQMQNAEAETGAETSSGPEVVSRPTWWSSVTGRMRLAFSR